MSRALVVMAIVMGALAGCATPAPAPIIVEKTPSEFLAYSALQQWLNLQEEVSAMSLEKVVEELVVVDKPQGSQELFYFGLLNQQLKTYSSWTQARDAFRQVAQDDDLLSEQRQLAVILERYNQSRINWYQQQLEMLARFKELRQELNDSQEKTKLLEQKIQAITDLEAAISTRKEQ